MTDTAHYLAVNLARRTENIAQRMAAVEAHAGRELRLLDGYPTVTMGDGTPRGSSDLTSVERAGEGRRKLTGDLEEIRDTLVALIEMAGSVSKLMDRIGTLRVEIPVPRCNGGQGWDGAIEWGRPDCADVAESRYAGLCSPCWYRGYRWRVKHGVPDAERGVIQPGERAS